jgi:hypothetical protein
MRKRLVAIAMLAACGSAPVTKPAAPEPIAPATTSPAQSDGITTIARKERLIVVFNQGDVHFALALAGEELDVHPEDGTQWRIDGQVVHLQVVDISAIVQANPSADDKTILKAHAMGEIEAITKLNGQTSTFAGEMTNKQTGVVYEFFVVGLPPDSATPEMEYLATVTARIGDKVVMLASPLPAAWQDGQTNLLAMISTLTLSATWLDPQSFEKD